MDADRPPAAIDADHPLHSILSGFSEPADDVLADLERDDDAIVGPGPPRRPSAGRPLDDLPEHEPFTPPVPVDTLHELAAEPRAPGAHAGSRQRGVADGLWDLLGGLPALPRPSRGMAIAGAAAVVIVTAVATQRAPAPRDQSPAAGGSVPPGTQAVPRPVRR
ncbi:MAG: hypothetical protein M3134_02770, partial [Actinomycetota bacterium]|nr:hypothetical protein [Actinomycetota bacterium]